MNDVDAWRRAHDLAEVGRYSDAEQVVRAGLGRTPDDADLLIMLGYLLRQQQRYLDALAACDAAVALAPDDADAHAQRAWVLLDICRVAEAVAAATEAVRLDPHRADRYVVLAEALAEDNRLDEARDSVRHALGLPPQSVSALLSLADIERQAGNRDQAGAVTRRALAIDPGNPRGRRLLAMLDADRGVVRRSMRALAELARDWPVDPDLAALLWPLRRVVAAPRWWLGAAAALVAALGALSTAGGVPAVLARTAAALSCAATAGFVLRTLVPAGGLPWRAVRLSPPLVRRSLHAGLAVITAAVGLLGGYAAGGPLALPLLAIATAPMLWACALGETLGHSLHHAGRRQYLHDQREQTRDLLGELRAWPEETRQTLHAAWHAGDDAERERQQRTAALRRPLAVYQCRLRNTVLSAAFALVAVIAGVTAAASRPDTGPTVGFGLFAVLMLYVSARVRAMKAVATAEGLLLHGPLWTAIVRWDRVTHVLDDGRRGLIPVRAPILVLTNGARFRVKQAAFYDLSSHNARHHITNPVTSIVAELEAVRRTYSSHPTSLERDPTGR